MVDRFGSEIVRLRHLLADEQYRDVIDAAANLEQTRPGSKEAALGHLIALCARNASGESLLPSQRTVEAALVRDNTQCAIYYAALACYHAGEMPAALDWLNGYEPSARAWQLRRALLLGAIRAVNHDLIEQFRTIEPALRNPDRSDQGALAAGAFQLAALVREIATTDSGFTTLVRAEALLEDPSVLRQRIHIIRAIAWVYALRGDAARSYQSLYRATQLAQTDEPDLLAWIHLDRAQAAIWAEERVHAITEYTLANELASKIDYAAITDERLTLLPTMALVGALLGEETDWITRAQEHCPQLSTHWSAAHDGRTEAFINEARAWLGNDEEAADAGAQAYATFAKLGSAWRSGRLALRLAHLARNKKWRQRAYLHLRSFPGNPFLRQAVPFIAQAANDALTPTLMSVRAMLMQGATLQEVADELQIAYKTARCHACSVYKICGVGGQRELLALAAKYRSA